MKPTTTYRVVGIRTDGSKRVLCDGLSSGELAMKIAMNLDDGSLFPNVLVERDDTPVAVTPRDGELRL